MIKILIGGSPCTHWSIAQKNNRETEAEGEGWELFKNYLIAKEKFQPDYFLYENNKSAAQPIKDQISEELKVPLQYINSSLVSAQNRERFYAHNILKVEQPKDRGIIVKDILEKHTDEIQYDLIEPLVPFVMNKFDKIADKHGHIPEMFNPYNISEIKDKTPTLTAQGSSQTKSCTVMVTEPVRIGSIGSNSQAHRVYSCYGKSVTLVANGGGQGAKTGLYAIPIEDTDINKPIYEVKNNFININNKLYPSKLPDGYYIIRKLTATEAARLQTMPDNYCNCISNSQAYKCLGNGWTAEVIIHILSHLNIPKNEEVVVLSMYDGIATGRYCFDRLGYKNIKYYAYEIDKYAIRVAQKNYPDIIQCGDAFDVRNNDWFISQ